MSKDAHSRDGEMNFAEIGKRLGITRSGAWMLYKSAMNKLRRNPRAKALLKERRT